MSSVCLLWGKGAGVEGGVGRGAAEREKEGML